VGYYLTFFFGGFIQYANRLARQYFRPFFVGPEGAPPTGAKRAYDIAGILVTHALLNYVVVPFQLLDLKRSFLAWHRLDWYGHIIVGGTIIFFLNGGKKVMRSAAAKRGVVIAGGKPSAPGKVVVPARGTNENGSPKSGAVTPATAPTTPGQLGAPTGFSLTVPPIEQGVMEAQVAFGESAQST
jgi:lysophospholipid acyltransferase